MDFKTIKIYNSWADVPTDYVTLTTLRREHLRLSPDQPVVGRKRGANGYYDLYNRKDAVSSRPLTAPQQEALARARAARCDACGVRGRLIADNGQKLCTRCHAKRVEVRTSIDVHQQSVEWAKRVMAEPDIHVVLDTETTGLGGTDQVIQMAIVDLAGNALFNSLFRPSVPVSEGAYEVHRISFSSLAVAPTVSDMFPEIRKVLDGRAVIAYNADFDRRMLEQSFTAHGLSLAWFSQLQFRCAMLQYAKFCGDWDAKRKSYRLQKLPSGDHSALGDARATLELILEMAR